jgi:surfeit locus 1 family protein
VTSGYRRFVVPGLSTLIMLIVLLALGTWQVYRLRWKEDILARIAAAESAPPLPLGQDPAPYTKVSVTGRFQFDRSAQLGAEVHDTRAGPELGFHQIVPLQLANDHTILVDRGWIPQKRTTPLDDPSEQVTVAGYVRPGEKSSWFSALDDTATRQFYTLDPETIGATVGATNVAPFALVALGPAAAETYPVPAQHLPRPPNNHLSYAITWYGLAVALVIIFGTWVRKALR